MSLYLHYMYKPYKQNKKIFIHIQMVTKFLILKIISRVLTLIRKQEFKKELEEKSLQPIFTSDY